MINFEYCFGVISIAHPEAFVPKVWTQGAHGKKKEKKTLKLKKERKEDPSTPRTNKKRPFPFFPQFELKVGEKSCELDYIFSSWCAEQE